MSLPEHMPAVLTRTNLENERIRADAAELRAETHGAGERLARADVEDCLAAMVAAYQSGDVRMLKPVLRRHGRL